MLNYNQIGILLGLLAIVVLLLIGKKIQNPYARCIWRSALLVCTLYAVILIGIEVYWHFLMERLKDFDLNDNGFVDLDEYSDEAMKTMDVIVQGSPEKNYAALTIALFSSFVSFAYLLADLIIIHKKTNNS